MVQQSQRISVARVTSCSRVGLEACVHSQYRETSLHISAAARATLLFGPCSKWEVNLTERLTDALRYISNNLYAWTDKLIKNSLFWLITDYMF